MPGRKVLVTGSNGFLGAAMCRAITERGDSFVPFDFCQIGGPTEVADITDRAAVEKLFARHRPDAVLHCAAVVVGTAAGGNGTATIMRVNIEGTVNVYEAALRYGARRVVHVSTEEVYGDFATPRVTEDHPLSPDAPYAISKAAADQLGGHYRRAGLDVVNLRTSWVYGRGLPRQRIPRTLVEAAVEGRPLHLPNGGDHMIDHTYLEDFTRGALLLVDAPALQHDCYHVGSGMAASVSDMVSMLSELVPGARLSVGPGLLTSAHGHPLVRKGALDISRICSELGYAPRFSLWEGLADYIGQLRAGY